MVVLVGQVLRGVGGECPAEPREPLGKVLRFARLTERQRGSIPVFDLRAAAGAFSDGTLPQETGFVQVVGVGHGRLWSLH